MQFLIDQWQDIALALSILFAIVQAVQFKQWVKLLPLAGELALAAAKMADLDNEAKRKYVVAEIAKTKVGQVLTTAQINSLVEAGWHLIAKPKVKGA